MQAFIDLSKCTGQARCYAADPELYQIDDIGYALRPEFGVAPGSEAVARAGAAACPERAITLE